MNPPDAPETPAPAEAYRVLARKYRPSDFSDLIGQEPMVRTLRNAFATGRVHQAYIFTGVRGVGKTTTARILARALNYKTDTIDQPSIDMPVLGEHCQSIIESRHVDVIEMDAASNTGIDDVREIIDASRYKPISARTKIYIIDEVHMLSKQAFNALLKTLEEPPPHVKFLFATTEIRKVPVTILSRCQRFDLRRIEADTMIAYLRGIVAKEGLTVEEEALALVARASEGSMRDALSLLDQAIAHGAGDVRADDLRQSLGLADRTRVIDLFEHLMRGRIAEALAEFDAQHEAGADPLAVLGDLAEFVHLLTRMKLAPDPARDVGMGSVERARVQGFARDLPTRALTLAWQVLLKGIQEVQAAPRPRIAAEMVLVRLAYAADLPSPEELIRTLRENGTEGGAGRRSPRGEGGNGPSARLTVENGGAARALAPAPRTEMPAGPASFREVVALAAARRDIALQTALERQVRLIAFEPGRIEFELAPGADSGLPNRLTKALRDWTGQLWGVAVRRPDPDRPAAPTLHEEAQRVQDEERRGVLARPLVRAALDAFPGAQITDVEAAPEPAASTEAAGAHPGLDLAPEDDDEL